MNGGGERIAAGGEKDWRAEVAEDERVFDIERGEGEKRISDGELASWLSGYAGMGGEEDRNRRRAVGASGEDNIRAQIAEAVKRGEAERRQPGELAKVKGFWVKWKKYLALREQESPEAKVECERVYQEVANQYSQEEILKFDRMGSYEIIRGEIMARRADISDKWRKEGVGTGKEWTAQMTTANVAQGQRVPAEKYEAALALMNKVEISTAYGEMARADRYFGVVRVPAMGVSAERGPVEMSEAPVETREIPVAPVEMEEAPVASIEMGEAGRAAPVRVAESEGAPVEMMDEEPESEPIEMMDEGESEGIPESEETPESEEVPVFGAPERKVMMISVNQDRQAKAVAEEVARVVAREDIGKTPGKVRQFLKSVFKWGMFGAMNRDITRKRAFETFRKIEEGEDVVSEKDPVAVAVARAKWDKMDEFAQTERFVEAVMDETSKDLLEKGEYIGDVYQVAVDESGRKVTKHSRNEAGEATETEYREGETEADTVLSIRDAIAERLKGGDGAEFSRKMTEIRGSEGYKKMAGTGINIENFAGISEALAGVARDGAEYNAAVERVMNGFSFVNAVAERKIRTHEGMSARQKIYEKLRGEKMDGPRAKMMGLLFSDTTAKVLTTAGMFAGSVFVGPVFAVTAAGIQGGSAWSERAKRMRGEQEQRLMTGESMEELTNEAKEMYENGGRRERRYARKVAECLDTQVQGKAETSYVSSEIARYIEKLEVATEEEREAAVGNLAMAIACARAMRNKDMLTFSSANQNEIEEERILLARSIARGAKALEGAGVEDTSEKITAAILKNSEVADDIREAIVKSGDAQGAMERETDVYVETANKAARKREAKEFAKGAAISAGITAGVITAGKIIQNLTAPKAETVVETAPEPARTTSSEGVTTVRVNGKQFAEEFGQETPKYVYAQNGNKLRFIRSDQGQLYVRGGDSIWISGERKTIEELVNEGRAVAEISIAPGSSKEVIVDLVPIEDGKFGVVTDNISLQQLIASGKVDRVNLSAIAENGTYVRQSAYAPHNYDGSLLSYYAEPTVGEAVRATATTAVRNATRVATPAMPIVAHPSDGVPERAPETEEERFGRISEVVNRARTADEAERNRLLSTISEEDFEFYLEKVREGR